MKNHLITAILLLPGMSLLAFVGWTMYSWAGAVFLPLITVFVLGGGISKVLRLNRWYAETERKSAYRDAVKHRHSRIKAARKRRIFWEKWASRFPTRNITQEQIRRRNQLQSDVVGGLFIAFYGSIFFWMGGKEFLLIYVALVIIFLGHRETPRQNHQ